MLLYLCVLLLIAAWKFMPRPWHPTVTLETAHHTIYSTAARQQTEDTAQKMEFLYTAYSNQFRSLRQFPGNQPKLKVKLFKDRKEFRWINPGLGWAEAFYREPYCRAYFSENEPNPYHWMLHESVHQLNHEVAHLRLEKWLEEGLADYFATSRLDAKALLVGHIDLNTYPVWWIEQIATSTNLTENIRNGSVIPLRSIITNRGGPRLSSHVNLYYLHWWTLTHFIFESAPYRENAVELTQRGGGLEAFEQTIGSLDRVESEWHAYVLNLKEILFGKHLNSVRSNIHREGSQPKE